jgi:hypothetical protein
MSLPRVTSIILLACLSLISWAQDGSVAPQVLQGVSLPCDFPEFIPSTNESSESGHIFITNNEGTPYLMILRNDGSPYFYRRMEDTSLDFKMQPNGMLTGWLGEHERGFFRMNEFFQILDTLKCKNGKDTDEHELQLLTNGHALMIAREERNITEIDPEGNPNSTVIGNHIQELDENGKLIFEWLCWDHFTLEDSYINSSGIKLLDYVHMNSIDVDYDGHLLLSSRHLSECTKIHRQSGEIIWRLGGKNNQFNFINDPDQISFQHDFRPVPGKPDHYTLFDNGNLKDPKYSRVVEYWLDTASMRAEKVWEYRHDPDRYSRLMGNAQLLPNGNMVVNWGGSDLPKITELSPDSTVVYEADFSEEMFNYRTFRFACDYTMQAPYLLVEPYPDRIRLLFNKFGDENVDYFKIYAGTDPEELEWIDSTSLPWMDLLDLEAANYYFLEVTAVDGSGMESPASNRERVYVRNSAPGDNLVLNGDFAARDSFWTHQDFRDASSSGTYTDSSFYFHIEAQGIVPADVQLYQTDIPLIRGKEYIMELDARADASRTIGFEVERDDIPWSSYSRHGVSYIGTELTHIEHTFRMEDSNDLHARLVVYGGASDIDFEVTNISLRQKVISGEKEPAYTNDRLHCYPNPAANNMQVSFSLDSGSDIDLRLYTLTGQLVFTKHTGRQPAGPNEINLNTSTLPDGSYVLQVESDSFCATKLVMVQH